jgi:hypothetical protein
MTFDRLGAGALAGALRKHSPKPQGRGASVEGRDIFRMHQAPQYTQSLLLLLVFRYGSRAGQRNGFAARLLDFFQGRPAESMSGNTELFCELAVGEHLQLIVATFYQPSPAKLIGRYIGARFESVVQFTDIDNSHLRGPLIVEAALGNAAHERHAAAFKYRVLRPARQLALAFVTAAGGLAMAGTRTSSQPLGPLALVNAVIDLR